MGLPFRPEPPEVREVLTSGLRRMASQNAFSTPLLGGMASPQLDTLEQGQGIPVYHLGLTTINDETNLGTAVLTTWRFLLTQNNVTIASADVGVGEGREPVFAQVNEGRLVEGLAQAIKAIQEFIAAAEDEFEVRLLSVPALYTLALWLVNTGGHQDLIVPIAPVSLPVRPNVPISIEEFLSELRKAAQERLGGHALDDPLLG